MPKFFCQQCHQRIKKKELPKCWNCRIINYEELKRSAKITNKSKKIMKTYLQEEELETPEEEKPEEGSGEETSGTEKEE